MNDAIPAFGDRLFRIRRPFPRGRCIAILLALSAAHALLEPSAANAKTLAVDCSPGSLVNAIAAANDETQSPGPDTLSLAAGCVYELAAVDNWWFGPNALPAISSAISIEGNGATISRSESVGVPPFRLFYVSGGLTAFPAGALTIRNVVLRNGLAKGGDSYLGGGGAGMGGAIFNQGTLFLYSVTLVENRAIGGGGGTGAGMTGGGIGGNGGYDSAGGFGGEFGAYGGSGGTSGYCYGAGGGGFAANGADVVSAAPSMGGGNSGWGGAGSSGGQSGDGGSGAFGCGNEALNGGAFGKGAAEWSAGGGVGGGGGYAFAPGYCAAAGGFGGGGGAAWGGDAGGGGFGGGGGSGIYEWPAAGFGGGHDMAGGEREARSGGGSGMGGAIFNNNGTLVLIDSTLTGNTARGGSNPYNILSNGAGLGGAVFNLQGDVTIVQSTLANNAVENENSSYHAGGGAVFNVGYLAGDDGGILRHESSILIVNSILSNSQSNVGSEAPPDLVDARPATLVNGVQNIATTKVVADAPNIVMNSSGVQLASTSVDPLLLPLADNGGPTPTMAPSPGSPAIDAGDACHTGLPDTDQRGSGFPRVWNGRPDLGSIEYGSPGDVLFASTFDPAFGCE